MAISASSLLVRDMPGGFDPSFVHFEPTLPPFHGPGGIQPPQGLIEGRMHPHEWKLVSFQHFVGLLHLAAPAGPFRAYAARPTLCTQSHIDECHRHSVRPGLALCRRTHPPMHTHARIAYMCNIPLFVSHPMGKTPCVMVEHAMLT